MVVTKPDGEFVTFLNARLDGQAANFPPEE